MNCKFLEAKGLGQYMGIYISNKWELTIWHGDDDGRLSKCVGHILLLKS